MITSFWKSKWFDMVVGIICFAVAITMMFFSGYEAGVVAWTVAGTIWIFGARISYTYECYQALAKRVADLEAELAAEKAEKE